MVDLPDPPLVAELRAALAHEAEARRHAWPKHFYAGRADFLARHGVGWLGPVPLPRGLRYRAPKQCFANALDLAARYPHRYLYVEGVVEQFIAVHHAWCIRRSDGLLIDQTLRPYEDEPFAYLGVPFDLEVLSVATWISQTRGAILDDWVHGYPLLRHPYDPTTAARQLWQSRPANNLAS